MQQPTTQQRQDAEIALRAALTRTVAATEGFQSFYEEGVIYAFQYLAKQQGFDSLAYIPSDIVDKYQVYPL